MTRRAARIRHDEVCRAIKAAKSMGLSVGRIIVEDGRFEIVIGGENGDIAPLPPSNDPTPTPLIREPKL